MKLSRLAVLFVNIATEEFSSRVNTKMLLAGWGACGINVHKANNTYKLATEEGYAFGRVPSGSYHFGGGGSRDAKDGSKLDLFWEKLVSCTGVDYDDLSDLERE